MVFFLLICANYYDKNRITDMQAVLAGTSIGITELKKNPSAVIREAGDETIVVLHHNKPSAYLVPAHSYEALMDVLDDLQLLPLVQQRIASWQADRSNVTEMSRDELVKIARGTTQKAAKSNVSVARK
jgi:antitoxin StbD